jgi:hypothetical protein
MKFHFHCSLIILLSALPALVLPALVFGGQQQDLEILPQNDLQPESVVNETGEVPDITIVERENATFEEYRINGRLYKVKVTPKIGQPYYLNYEDGADVSRRYDGVDEPPEAPVWDVLEF